MDKQTKKSDKKRWKWWNRFTGWIGNKVRIPQNSIWQVLLVIFLFFVLALFSFYFPGPYQDLMDYTSSWDGTLGLITLFVALAIWGAEKRKQWEDHLPKRLTVHCVHKGKYIMTCHNAYLADESDIRPWGQQVSRQMNTELNELLCNSQKHNLEFNLNIVREDIGPIKGEYKLYNVTIDLSDVPDWGHNNDISVVWIEAGIDIDKKKFWFKSRPTEVTSINDAIKNGLQWEELREQCSLDKNEI